MWKKIDAMPNAIKTQNEKSPGKWPVENAQCKMIPLSPPPAPPVQTQ